LKNKDLLFCSKFYLKNFDYRRLSIFSLQNIGEIDVG